MHLTGSTEGKRTGTYSSRGVAVVPDTPDTSQIVEGCTICSSPTGDSGRLCRTHTDQLAAELATVPDIVDELQITRTRQDRVSAGKHGGRSATKPLPWNEHAAQRAFELNATLNAWALDTSRLGEDERDLLAEHHHSDTAAVARWLARNLRTLRQHADAGQAFDELTNAIREARRAVDRPQDYIPLGACGNLVEDLEQPCPAIVYGHPDSRFATCRGCTARHRITDRIEWMLELLRVQLVTIPEAVGICYLAGKRTTEDKLRLMAARARFLPVGAKEGQPTYRMAEVFQALDERYKHRKPRAA
jgi:hypothetical protein